MFLNATQLQQLIQSHKIYFPAAE